MSPPTGPSHWRWRDGPLGGGPAVIVDVDGVISDAASRQPLAQARRWDEFFAGCPDDPPLEAAVTLVDSLAGGVAVVLLTARPWPLLDDTVAWLKAHQVRWDLLILRPPGDSGRSRDYKAAEVASLRRCGFELRCALDDDPRNVEMYAEAGVPCVYIYSGYYDR
ncbi:MAG: hypothetical protein OXF64_09135 [bacterium]|nr:hypothetical protein [bacterium]MCY4273253.1 hypothetical protein [bacterium]